MGITAKKYNSGKSMKRFKFIDCMVEYFCYADYYLKMVTLPLFTTLLLFINS